MNKEQARLQEIRARENAAIVGEWVVPKNAKKAIFTDHPSAPGYPMLVAKAIEPTDAEFIAHARQDIPYLLDLVESLQREKESAPFDGLKDADAIDQDIIKFLMGNEKELRNWIVRASWHCAKVHTQSDEIAALTARAEQAERERDAAVADIEELLGQDDFIGICWACKIHDKCVGTRDVKITCVPKWRGLPQEGEVK